MSTDFDPYHKWLGIPPREQPPHHYRLLSIDLFESDNEVIEAAANRLMDYVQQCATGPHVEHSQRLLNEISSARICLLKANSKQNYDEQLREDLATRVAAPPVGNPVTAVPPPAPRSTTRQTPPPRNKKTGKKSRREKAAKPDNLSEVQIKTDVAPKARQESSQINLDHLQVETPGSSPPPLPRESKSRPIPAPSSQTPPRKKTNASASQSRGSQAGSRQAKHASANWILWVAIAGVFAILAVLVLAIVLSRETAMEAPGTYEFEGGARADGKLKLKPGDVIVAIKSDSPPVGDNLMADVDAQEQVFPDEDLKDEKFAGVVVEKRQEGKTELPVEGPKDPSSPVAADPPVVKPENEKPNEPVAVAKVEPSVPKPEPKPKHAPFRDFPQRLDLPPLTERVPHRGSDGVLLGKLDLSGTNINFVEFELLGGDLAPTGKLHMISRSNESLGRRFAIQRTVDYLTTDIAEFFIKDSQLRFLWLVDSSASHALYLKSCLLQMKISKVTKVVQLREPATREPIGIDWQFGKAKRPKVLPQRLGGMPRAENMRLIVHNIPNAKVSSPQAAVGQVVLVGFLEGNRTPLGTRLMLQHTTGKQRVVVDVTCWGQANGKTFHFSKEKLASQTKAAKNAIAGFDRQVNAMRTQVEALKAISSPEKQALNQKDFQSRAKVINSQKAVFRNILNQLDALAKILPRIQGATMPYSVIAKVGEHKVVLIEAK